MPLQQGPLAGAGIDVVDGEWDADIGMHPLLQYARDHENLVITPYTSGVTFESQQMAFAHMVEKLRHYLLSHG